MLRSDLCDFSDAYIVVKGDITVTEPNNGKRNKSVAYKNNAQFINCITKANSESFKYKASITGNYTMLVMVKIVMMQTKLVKIKLRLLFH